jgi:hypothetical protein
VSLEEARLWDFDSEALCAIAFEKVTVCCMATDYFYWLYFLSKIFILALLVSAL